MQVFKPPSLQPAIRFGAPPSKGTWKGPLNLRDDDFTRSTPPKNPTAPDLSVLAQTKTGQILNNIILTVESSRQGKPRQFTGRDLLQCIQNEVDQPFHTSRLAHLLGSQDMQGIQAAMDSLTRLGWLVKVSSGRPDQFHYWRVSQAGSRLLKQIEAKAPGSETIEALEMMMSERSESAPASPREVLQPFQKLMGLREDLESFLRQPSGVIKKMTHADVLKLLTKIESKHPQQCFWVSMLQNDHGYSFDKPAMKRLLEEYGRMGLLESGNNSPSEYWKEWRTSNLTRNLLEQYGTKLKPLKAAKKRLVQQNPQPDANFMETEVGKALSLPVLSAGSKDYSGANLMSMMLGMMGANKSSVCHTTGMVSVLGAITPKELGIAMSVLCRAGLVAEVYRQQHAKESSEWTVTALGKQLLALKDNRKLESMYPVLAPALETIFMSETTKTPQTLNVVTTALNVLMGEETDWTGAFNTPLFTGPNGTRYSYGDFLCLWQLCEESGLNLPFGTFCLEEFMKHIPIQEADKPNIYQALETLGRLGLMERGLHSQTPQWQSWKVSNLGKNLVKSWGYLVAKQLIRLENPPTKLSIEGIFPSTVSRKEKPSNIGASSSVSPGGWFEEIENARVNGLKGNIGALKSTEAPKMEIPEAHDKLSVPEQIRKVLQEPLLIVPGQSMTGLQLLEKILGFIFISHAFSLDQLTKHCVKNSDYQPALEKALKTLESIGVLTPMIFHISPRILKTKHSPPSFPVTHWMVNAFGRKLVRDLQTMSDDQVLQMAALMDVRETSASVKKQETLPDAGASELLKTLEGKIFQANGQAYTGQELLKKLNHWTQENSQECFRPDQLSQTLSIRFESEQQMLHCALYKLFALGLLEEISSVPNPHNSGWAISALGKHLLKSEKLFPAEIQQLGALYLQDSETLKRYEAMESKRLDATATRLKNLLVPDEKGMSGKDILMLFPALKQARSRWAKLFGLGVHVKAIAGKLGCSDVKSVQARLSALAQAELCTDHGANQEGSRWSLTERGEALIKAPDVLQAMNILEGDVEGLLRKEIRHIEAQKGLQQEKILKFIEELETLGAQATPASQGFEEAQLAAEKLFAQYQGAETLKEKQVLQVATFEQVFQAELKHLAARDHNTWRHNLHAQLNALQTEHVQWLHRANQTLLKLNRSLMQLERYQSGQELERLRQNLKFDPEAARQETQTLTDILVGLFTQMDTTIDVAKDAAQLEQEAIKRKAEEAIQQAVGHEELAKRVAALQKAFVESSAIETEPLQTTALNLSQMLTAQAAKP